MLEPQALAVLSALSQETRLRVIRLLVEAGPKGMAAGQIGAALGRTCCNTHAAPSESPSASRLSFHLSHLERAGLISPRREGRHIIYTARDETLQALIGFLRHDCGQSHPETCPPLRHQRESMIMDVTIYHNPACGTSRNTLALIRNAGIEPQIIEYLKTPPSREALGELIAATGGSLRPLLREKGTPFSELGLGDPSLSEDDLIQAVLAHPILLNRPLVVTPKGTKLCRPSEEVLDLLPSHLGASPQEDGAQVIASQGENIAKP